MNIVGRKTAKNDKTSGVAVGERKGTVQRLSGRTNTNRHRVNSYTKGKRGQIEARNLWRLAGYTDTESQTQDQARKSDSPPPDLRGSLEKEWYVEVKLVKKMTNGLLQRYWSKLMDDAGFNYGGTARPVLMYRENRGKWRVLRYPFIGEHEYLAWHEFQDKYLRAGTPAPKEEE